MKKVYVLLTGLLVLLVLALSACSAQESKDPNVLLNVKEFNLISSKKLLQKMGEPEKVENWEYQKSESETLPMTTYTFQNNRFEFVLYDDKVQRISIYADSYNDFTAPGFSFNEKDDILRALGIDPATVPESSRIDTGQALRYESIGKIRYIWVPSYEGNSYDEIKISFSDLL